MGAVAELKRTGNPDVADKLRQIADKIEAGELTEVIVVANAPERNSWYHYQHFDDQVRLIGACEFAKAAIFEAALRG